jgi:transcriptional regulator with XRE-family HTH domain
MAKALDQFREDLLTDPEVRKEYDRLAPEFEVAKAIIGARQAAGLTQAQMAERMGSPQSYIARLEAGTTLPNLRTIYRVGEATGTRPEVVFHHQNKAADTAT